MGPSARVGTRPAFGSLVMLGMTENDKENARSAHDVRQALNMRRNRDFATDVRFTVIDLFGC